MTTTAQDFEARQRAEELAQSASLATPPAPTTAQPFPADTETALAKSISELKEKDAEYQRLASEESRQQWEAMASANLARNQELEAHLKNKAAAEAEQAQSVSDARVSKLLEHANELNARITAEAAKSGPLTPWNVDTDLLRDWTMTTQELDRAARERGLPGLEAIVPQSQQQPAGQQQQPADNTANQNAVPQIDFSKIPDVTRWQLDSMAQSLGYADGREMVADQISVRQEQRRLKQELAALKEEKETENIALSFQLQNPDFPGDQTAIDKLSQIMETNGLAWTAENMGMAHAYAVKSGQYQPLSPDLVAVANNGGAAAPSRLPAPRKRLPAIRSITPLELQTLTKCHLMSCVSWR